MDLPEGVTHSHTDEYDPDKHGTITATHPDGSEVSFTYERNKTDKTIRYEFGGPDRVVGAFDNPDYEGVEDPDTDDVIWDAAAGHYVERITASEAGSSSEATG